MLCLDFNKLVCQMRERHQKARRRMAAWHCFEICSVRAFSRLFSGRVIRWFCLIQTSPQECTVQRGKKDENERAARLANEILNTVYARTKSVVRLNIRKNHQDSRAPLNFMDIVMEWSAKAARVCCLPATWMKDASKDLQGGVHCIILCFMK